MGKYFGTDGFRGEAGKTLTPRHAYLTGRFLGSAFGAGARILIGKDTRRSGDLLEAALSAGIAESGSDVYLLGVVSTPAVAYLARTEGFAAAVMISASHNPFYDNGLKVISGQGEKMDEETLLKIEALFDGGDAALKQLPAGQREGIGRILPFPEGAAKYEAFLENLPGTGFSPERKPFAGKKIALDCANGSASAFAEKVFRDLGAETVVIHSRPDGLNINVDCGSTHVESLLETVVREKCDAGFAFDGDADRCFGADEKGEVIDGDRTLYLCGTRMQEQKTLKDSTVVVTVMSNLGLLKALEAAEIGTLATPVGDKYVHAALSEKGLSLGGEQSGHVIFPEVETTGDGLVTALKLMEVLLSSGKPFSELLKDYRAYPQYLENVRVSDKEAAVKHPAVQAAVQEAEETLRGSGRILLRPSGTEPVVRVMAEAATDRLCREMVGQIADAMKQAGLVQ